MRLTLRTMLAALDADDRLDPADVEELLAKIEQSPFATNLANQIRRVVQHPRLGSPRLDGKGMGLDPNSVAEYLDSTLASDKIAEFERVCIASEVQLAEVASCHQILVLVLEQPAEIDPAMRDRMYRLGAESKRTMAEAQASLVHTAADGSQHRIDRPASPAGQTRPEETQPQPKPKPEVPDYLRAGRKPAMWPMVLAALLAFVAVLGVLRLLGPLDRSHPMAKLLRGSAAEQEEAANVGASETDGNSEIVAPPLRGDQDTSTEGDVSPGTGDDKKNVTPEPVELNPGDAPEVAVTPMDPPEPMDTTEPMPAVEPPVVVDDGEKPLVNVDPTPTEPAPVEPPQPVAAEVGRALSENQVLVRREADGRYERVPARASVFAGDELTVFTGYRPQLNLAGSVQLTVAGESRLRLGMNDADGVAHLTLEFGNLLAGSVGRGDVQLGVRAGHIDGTVTFANVDSEVAIEVRNYLPPGGNPFTVPIIPVTRIYVTRGKVVWRETVAGEAGQAFEIQSGEVRTYLANEPGFTTTLPALPDWIDGKDLADIDRLAARDIEPKLAGERPLELTLVEMASEGERRAELRALSVRALATLDQFDPLVSVFRDESQRAYWTAEFDSLRSAIARSPETAEAVRAALQKSRGEKPGDDLYRMLWGYSPLDLDSELQKLGQGPAAQLVMWLDSEDLDYRVFAFENLRRITGSTQLYLPHLAATRRRTPIAQWRERLKNGEIVYKSPPAPINDPKPTGAVNAPARASTDPLLD